MTNLYSFIDIFQKEMMTDEGSIPLEKIVIPIIQRDYAQGRRNNNEIERVRNRFLEALLHAFTDQPIILDFVYGEIDENGCMIPLDGQQRLTTLFLLHWFAAKKEKIEYDRYQFLKKFSYETRYSARDFCSDLIDFNPTFQKEKISEEIMNQSWFPLDWAKDQTIDAMLNMLDAIQEKWKDLTNIWDKLENGVIQFYFLPMKEMGLTDELYIKMNSRGKPLTPFENFKAELEQSLKEINPEKSKVILNKIDQSWTDLLWSYRDKDHIIDDYFLRYFRYICDMICYKNGDTPSGKEYDEIDLIKEFFSKDSIQIERNIEILESYFDCWTTLMKKVGIDNFFHSHLSYQSEANKLKMDTRYPIDLFDDCINNNGSYIENRNSRKFPLGRQILLYAFITYLLNTNIVEESAFIRRIRIINNLINNSLSEISNSETRMGGNRIPAILEQVDSIILKGKINFNLDINFNTRQLVEEQEKLEWTTNNPEKQEKLFQLEDNDLLYGQIGILGLENYHLFDKFNLLFQCDLDKINCALLTFGDYGQIDRWRYQLGSINESSWRNLFHQGLNKNFENTREVLCNLLSALDVINPITLDEKIHEYLSKCENNQVYDWRYYYIKYPEFRPGKFGKYYWESLEKRYVVTVMVTESKLSENAYSPFLKCVDWKEKLSKDYLGQRIIEDGKYIINTQTSYQIVEMNTDKVIEEYKIPQNEDGIDTINRIEAFREFYKNNFSHSF